MNRNTYIGKFVFVAAICMGLVVAARGHAPSAVWVDDDFTPATPGWGVTSFASIQNGIDAVATGGTVNVAAGTYAPFKVTGLDGLTINGIGNVMVSGALDVSAELTLPRFSGKTTKAVVLINDSTVDLNGLDIEGIDLVESGTHNFGFALIYQNSSGTVSNCIASPNDNISRTPDICMFGTTGIGIWEYPFAGSAHVTIKNCTTKEFGNMGITVWNGAKALIKDNTISGQTYSEADKEIYGINVDDTFYTSGPHDVCEVTITGNEIYNCDNTVAPVLDARNQSAAIHLNAYLEYGNELESKVTITDNTIHNNRIGIYAVNCSPGNTSARNNAIYSNRIYGVVSKPDWNDEHVVFDAASNWWGAADGPGPVGPGSGDKVGANVAYYPWYLNEAMATLSVQAAITTQPQSRANNQGSIAGFTVAATGTAPLFYQWQKNTVDIRSATNATYTIASVVTGDAGDYRCIVGNMVNAATSSVATLTVVSGGLGIQVTPASGSWQLTAPVGYTGPTAGADNLAVISVPTGLYSLAWGALSGYVAPSNQTRFVTGGSTSLFSGVYLQISTNITTPPISASEGSYTNKIQISWQGKDGTIAYKGGVLGYQIWRSRTNDPATAVWLADIPANSSFAGGKNLGGLGARQGAAFGGPSSAAVQIAPCAWKLGNTYIYDDYGIVPIYSYYYWVRAKTATQISPMSYAGMGYASLPPEQAQGMADIGVSDLVFLPVNVTNGSHAETVSCRLQNNGPDLLSDAGVAFNFYMGTNATGMAWIGSVQSNMTLNAGGEKLIILTPSAKCALTVRGDLIGVQQVKVVVRHVSTLSDPNLANNTTNAAGSVRVKTSGANSPGRSLNDYDGDGKSDLCLYQSALGRWYAKVSGNRYGTDPSIGDVGMGWTPIPGDYDGDGLTDVAAYERSSGHWLVLLSSNSLMAGCYLGGSEFTAAQCDFDGDAKTDPVIYREADGYWEGAASSRRYTLCSTYLGETGYQSVIADYDGDGLADPAVYNRTTGLWGVALSGNGYQVVTGEFGGLGYLPVSADYDGDGRVDFGLYEYATGWWYGLMSNRSTGPVGQGYREASVQLGAPYGLPVVADYDGDGLADPAVYHQDTGWWDLFFSSRGYHESSGGFGGPQYQPATE